MARQPERTRLTPEPAALETLSIRELLRHTTSNAVLLAKKELALASTEFRADLKQEIAMAKGLAIAGLFAFYTLSMLLLALVLCLGNVMDEWLAELLVAGAVLLAGTVAGLIGWGKRVKQPLEASRKSLKQDWHWVKERLA